MITVETHFWWTDRESTASAFAAHSVMSARERAREVRFRRPEDRRTHRCTRLLVRSVLASRLGIAPSDVEFEENRYGRPRLAASHGVCGRMSFNLSHTLGLVALAVAEDDEMGSLLSLGMDVERIRPGFPVMSAAPSVCTASELRALAAVCHGHDRVHRFFEIWTTKEACLKAVGAGFSLSPTKLSVGLMDQNREVDVHLDDELVAAGHWHFVRCDPSPEYVATLAVLTGRPERPYIQTYSPVAPHAPCSQEPTLDR